MALTAFVILLGGCGGGGETTKAAPQTAKDATSETTTTTGATSTPVPTSPSQAPLPKARFIRLADAICLKHYITRGDLLLRFARRTGSLSKAESEQLISKVVIPTYRQELEELEALVERSAPKGDEGTLAAIAEALDSLIQKAEEDPASILEGAAEHFAAVTKLDERYGFRSCGRF